MSDSWQASVVLITSSNPGESHFGTGFVIDKDEQTTRLLTCAHVVRDVGGPEKIEIDGTQASVIASSPEEGADLAVLRIERLLDMSPLPLYAAGEKGKPFSTAGFQLDGRRFLIRALHGTLGEQVGVQMRGQADRIRAWDLEITDKYLLQPGYSGSPIVDEYDNVIGVVNTRRGEGKTGVAISIEVLKKVWPGMPPGLFEQDAVVTIEKDKTQESAINHKAQIVAESLPYIVGVGRSRPSIRLKPIPQGRSFAEMTSVLFQKASKSSPHLIRQPQNRTLNTIISEWSEAVRTDNPLILIFDFAADIEFALFSIARQLHGCQWVDGSGFTDASLATWKEEERTTVNIDDWPASVFLVDFSSVALSHISKQLPDSMEKIAPIAFEQRLSTFLRWAKSAHHHIVLGIPKYLLTDGDFAAFQKQTDYIFLPEKLFSAVYLDRVKQCKQHLRSTMPLPDLLAPLVSANSSSLPIVLARLLNEITTGQVVTEGDEHEATAILLDLARSLTAEGFYEIAFRIEQYCATLKAKRKSVDLQADVYLNAEDENGRIVSTLNTVADLPVILQYGAITGETGLGKTTSLHTEVIFVFTTIVFLAGPALARQYRYIASSQPGKIERR